MTCQREPRRSRPVRSWRPGAVGVALVGVLISGCTLGDGTAASGSTPTAQPTPAAPTFRTETNAQAAAELLDGSAVEVLIRSHQRDAVGGERPGRLVVRRAAHTVAVAASAAEARRLSLQLRTAARAVETVTGPRPGPLVAYWPPSRSLFDSFIGVPAGSYDAIAAVTTRLDPTRVGSPVAVVLNPDVFPRLSPLGRRVVMAHESAHAATPDGAAPMPAWLAEGFAEYVGIGAIDVARSHSLRSLVRELRRSGVPPRLPSDAAFAASAPHLNATYAQAWLVVRLLARRYGEPRMVHFYDTVAADPGGLRAALRGELGTTVQAITRLWQVRLRGLAHGG